MNGFLNGSVQESPAFLNGRIRNRRRATGSVL